MKLSNYEQMVAEYQPTSLSDDDIEMRKSLLDKYKASVIFEGDFLEFDNANNWLKANLRLEDVPFIFYGKLDYDYGFFELFFFEEKEAKVFEEVIPTLFTMFPDGTLTRTDGFDRFITQ